MSAYLGQIAAIATAFLWSFTALFFAYSGRRIGPNVVSRSRLLFALLLIATAHLLLEGTLLPWSAEPYRWFWLAVSSVLGLVLGDSFLFIAYATIGARLSMLMMSLSPLLSTVAGWWLFGERLAAGELIGIGLSILGVTWTITGRRTGTEATIERRAYALGLLAALAGSMFQALNLITARLGLEGEFPAVSAAVMRIFVAVVILWAITALRGRVRYTVRQWRDRPAFQAMMAGTVAGPFLGIWFSMIAIQLAPLGIASTLMALAPVIVIPINYLLFHEAVTWRSVAGTLTAFAGVALIFLS